jgi:peptidoglycan hydrolase CwlO-like protein
MAELALTGHNEAEYGELEQTIKTQKDLIEALKKQVGELERQVEAQSEEVDQLEQECEELEDEVTQPKKDAFAGEQITELARIRAMTTAAIGREW